MKKIRIFALILAIITIFSSVAFAAGFRDRYHKNPLRRGSGSTNSPSLKPYVANLQGDINDTGRGYCGVPDGIFGSQTKKGVEKYQYAKALSVDGVAGDKTKGALWHEIGWLAPPVSY